MKRLTSILAISVIAVMSAGAARADIASTTYVDKAVSPVSNKADANASAITALQSDKQDKSAMVDSTSENLSEDNDANYPTVAAVYTIATNALGGQVNNKLDKKFTGDANKSKAVITDANGAITTGTISSAMITDATIVNADIAPGAAIATSKISGLDTTLANKQAKLNDTQLNAVNSGITSGKVATYDGYDAKITANASAAAAAKSAADTAQATANKAVVANAAITAGTGTKITYDAKGLVTGSTSLAASDIPALAISKINGLDTALAGKQAKLVSSGDNANISGSNGVTVTVGTDGKIAVSGNKSAIDTALAGKQDTLSTAQLAAANSGITAAKVSNYDTAVTTANNALPKATYEAQVGTVSAANMGTTATTVVGAIKEIKNAVSTTDGAAVKKNQGTANKDKAVITDANGAITTGTISSGMITDGTIATADLADSSVTTAKIANLNVTEGKIAANAVTSGKIANGTIVDADISGSAAIATSKISGLDTALAGKIPVPSVTNSNGKLVLTYDSDTKAYAWESIGR